MAIDSKPFRCGERVALQVGTFTSLKSRTMPNLTSCLSSSGIHRSPTAHDRMGLPGQICDQCGRSIRSRGTPSSFFSSRCQMACKNSSAAAMTFCASTRSPLPSTAFSTGCAG